MSFCKNCGLELEDHDNFCPRCGTKIMESPKKKDNETLNLISKILMIITFVSIGMLSFDFLLSSFEIPEMMLMFLLCILPLAWTIPMTVYLFGAFNKQRKISTKFKICFLIFCNIIVGILLLCRDESYYD